MEEPRKKSRGSQSMYCSRHHAGWALYNHVSDVQNRVISTIFVEGKITCLLQS